MKKTLPKTTKTIAFVSDSVYPHNKGGKEKRLYEISTRLSKMGHDVHIYTMKWWDGPDTITENGVQLHAISRLYPLYAGDRRSIKQGILFGLACFRMIGKRFDVIDADHMPHFPLFSLKLVALAKRKPLYVVWHEVWGRKYWVEYMGAAGNIAALVEWASIRMPSHVISISNHTSELLRNQLKYKGKLDTISVGIDYGHISSIKPAKDKVDLIFAGRLLKHKNVDMLLMIIDKLHARSLPVSCLIIGDGPEKERLTDLCRSLGLEKHVEFRPFMESHDDLYAAIKAAKVFVFPSTREGFGIVAAEANACGKPVVTTDFSSNAAQDLIEEGVNGYVFTWNLLFATDSVQLALHNAAKMEPACIEAARKLDWGKLTKQTAGVYAA